MQELMIYAGVSDCYSRCDEILEKFLSVKVNAMQVYRVSDSYGEQLGKEGDFTERILPPVQPDEVLYAMGDGSMIFTRDDGWKEVKLGRIFKSSDCIHVEGKQGWIKQSQYLGHLGSSKSFTGQMDEIIENYGTLHQRLIFITDGATWLRNWIEDAFPEAVSILDFYHAKEHLCEFANEYFKESAEKGNWIEAQEALLLGSAVALVINNIKSLRTTPIGTAQKLIDYYSANAHRMDYKRYQQIGKGIIGSGAIESAHRTVIQKRMKLSGQRWTLRGAQNMLNLRTIKMNQQWTKVVQLVKSEFRAVA